MKKVLSFFVLGLTLTLGFGQEISTINPNSIPDSEYVTVKNGQLFLKNQRIRFWGAIGTMVGPQKTIQGDPYYIQRVNVQRIKDMGFNLIRFWHFGNFGEFGIEDRPYQKGDLSYRDCTDFFLAECKRQGIYVWPAGLGGGGVLFEKDVDQAAKIINDPTTEAEWKEAVRQLFEHHWAYKERVVRLGFVLAVVWDERLEKLAIANMKKMVNHVNLHTGLRYADDPVFAIWEIINEQWWPETITKGHWLNLPLFFRRSLLQRWHAFLKEKYQNQDNLLQAWKFLLPGEDLEKGTILLAPLANEESPIRINDTNPHALAAFKTVQQKYGRKDFTFQRGADVMEFFTQLLVNHKKRWAAELKTWGKSCKLCPLIFDTGIGSNAISQYMHQHADAVAHAAYMEGFTFTDPNHKRYPFYSLLDAPPRICKDVPWLEHNRVEGKPYFCYETQTGNPGKYRTEFPLIITALASIQDWDVGGCFHYWSMNRYDYTKPNPYEGPLSNPGDGAYQYDYTHDEITFAVRKAAGYIFCNQWLRPAPNPTKYIFGRRSLYNPSGMDYAGHYGEKLMNMLDTTYRYGVRLLLDPTRETDEIIGPEVRFIGFDKPCPIRPTEQIEFDYQKGHLIFDAEGVVAYTGFFAQYGSPEIRWQHAPVSLTELSWHNPPNTPYPVTDKEKYMTFVMVSTTSQPLLQSSRIYITLVSTSFNQGVSLTPEKCVWGDQPVLITRVSGKLVSPILKGKTCRMYNFKLEVIHEEKIQDETFVIPANLPIFYLELIQ